MEGCGPKHGYKRGRRKTVRRGDLNEWLVVRKGGGDGGFSLMVWMAGGGCTGTLLGWFENGKRRPRRAERGARSGGWRIGDKGRALSEEGWRTVVTTR